MFGSRFHSAIGPVGIDFGASGIKMLQLRRHGTAMRVVGAARLDPQVTDNPTRDAHALEEALRQAIAARGFTGRRCLVSLPRSDYSIQAVRMPRLADAEMREAAAWEAAERFKLDRASMQVDFIRMGEVQRGTEARDEVLLIAAPLDRLQARLESIMASGLRPMAVDTPVTALVRCHSQLCRRESDQSHVRAFLEVGGTGSFFTVTQGDQIALCKPVPFGGKDFDKAVAEHLGIEPAVARDLRRRRLANRSPQEAPSSDATDHAVFEAVRGLLDRIVKEVGLCLRYYGVTFRGHPPDRLILSGGDAMEPHFADMLASACKLRVMTDDPASPVADLFAEVEKAVGPAGGPAACWAVAAGLSMRGMPGRSIKRAKDTASPRGVAA